ncbi:hypothetical protein FF2_009466 [Malus domestica]
MKNEILQEQYEKVFEMLHEARYIKTHELITLVEVNHQLGAPQHGGSFALDMGIPIKERATHRNGDQHETSLNPAISTRSKKSGGRHLLTKGVERSKAVFRDCRDFLKQRRDNLIHVSSKINDPRVSEKLSLLPCPRSATNLGKGQQVLEKHEGTTSPRKNHMLLIKPSYFQEELEIYEKKLQWYMTSLMPLLSYGSLTK